ncbi:MAG: hypothetical protein R3E96_00405 [Planctomycetota bacterium]
MARRHDIQAVMTRTDHQSGTDRVREALDQLKLEPEVVLNVQADEPDLEPADLAKLIEAFMSRSAKPPAQRDDRRSGGHRAGERGGGVRPKRSRPVLLAFPLPNRAHVRPGAPALATPATWASTPSAPTPCAPSAICPRARSSRSRTRTTALARTRARDVCAAGHPGAARHRHPEDYAEFTARAARAQGLSPMTKHIFITGGVVSSLGKGLTSAAIGMILERRGLKSRCRS